MVFGSVADLKKNIARNISIIARIIKALFSSGLMISLTVDFSHFLDNSSHPVKILCYLSG